MKMEYW